ncbi:MAG: tRNA (adenosine(37)-N6)-threonylcarbamoyltransferase complex transferase subunit TsaD [Bacteroidetes bacterium]|nr:tRNA (adenosine(37)-N6)-threonylcarbamoyltransferase complex transferase subunit TsaD [Bacteroidia bacterium]MBL4715961.1 tRNA (adenosine(37)-N6)-threonylcarbamoyltransferase complex transferase subunit TsaD [Bacteroidia bacterium]PCH69272.1 MAG: tRNA (adenosine(37)-N6)-threonylcarbamoyltransferase complex transferase subunit TsaD [Bacteroidota bacterium]
MAVILGIESSCDETSAAVCRDGEILSNVIANQDVHKEWGGVVPELASRAHQQNIIPVVDNALKQAKVNKSELTTIAFTRGPGLLGPLLVGTSFAKSFAFGLNIPIIEVNHMQAHVLAHFIDEPKPQLPFLCLTVSGGHTQIVLVKDQLDMEVIGETTDDAAGEAFDKSAKILGLGYPGGPMIDKHAQLGDKNTFQFPEPNISGLDFSFSGLKTAILNFINNNVRKDDDFIKNNMNNICASIQNRIVTILMNKLEIASEQTNINEIAIAGGVSANSGLRKGLEEYGLKNNWNTYIPIFEYCTDNAAMIAIVGYFKFLKEDFANQDIETLARYPL